MPELKNPKHEAFAHAYASGKLTESAAYMKAYPKCKSKGAAAASATRLLKDAKIAERIDEIRSTATTQAIQELKEELSFNAREQFERLERLTIKAEEANQFDVASKNRLAMLEMFGYKDHPTLTHEHVNRQRVDFSSGQTIPVGENGHPVGQNQNDQPLQSGSRFSGIIPKIGKGGS